jgi:hypothetical protein
MKDAKERQEILRSELQEQVPTPHALRMVEA